MQKTILINYPTNMELGEYFDVSWRTLYRWQEEKQKLYNALLKVYFSEKLKIDIKEININLN